MLPLTPPVDPVTKGVRILVYDNTGATVVDATIPGGAYSTLTKTGWQLNRLGTRATYNNRSTTGPWISGIRTVTVSVVPKTPGLFRFSVGGKKANIANVPAANLPVTAKMLLDPPFANSGQCGNALFPGGPRPTPHCAIIRGVLRCS